MDRLHDLNVKYWAAADPRRRGLIDAAISDTRDQLVTEDTRRLRSDQIEWGALSRQMNPANIPLSTAQARNLIFQLLKVWRWKSP
jgi:hypothetical protein